MAAPQIICTYATEKCSLIIFRSPIISLKLFSLSKQMQFCAPCEVSKVNCFVNPCCVAVATHTAEIFHVILLNRLNM